MTAQLPSWNDELGWSLRKAERARKWNLMLSVVCWFAAGVLAIIGGFVLDPQQFATLLWVSFGCMALGILTTILSTSWDSRIRYLKLRQESHEHHTSTERNLNGIYEELRKIILKRKK